MGSVTEPASALDEALAALRRRDGARAEAAAREARAGAPGDPRADAALALALLLLRRRREALAPAEGAVAGSGGAPFSLLVRSAVRRDLGLAGPALADADAVATARPGSARAHAAVALAAFAAGSVARARDALDRARALAPADPLVLRLLGELELRRDPAGAEALFRASLRSDPRSGGARGALARALAHEGKAGEAEATFATAVAYDPNVGREREARRRAAVAFVQAAIASVLAVVGIMFAPSAIASRWPSALPLATTLSFVAGPIVPVVLVVWATFRMRRAREEGPPDAQIEALADELAEADAPVARPGAGG